MANKTRKIVRRDGIDRISNLPDDVLVRILSLLPTIEAVTTSLLSKRWKSLWILLPELDLDYACFSIRSTGVSWDDRERRFLDFVEHVLSLHEPEPLQKLRLKFDTADFNNYSYKASMVVKLGMESNCLRVDLDLSSQTASVWVPEYDVFSEMHTLPPCIFPHPSVSQLILTGCKLVSSFYKSFTSVKIAKLTSVELQKDSVYDLVSKCPCLEELQLLHCKIPSSYFELNAPESNLKCLELHSCRGNEGLSFEHASIQIPTLLQLKYIGDFRSAGYLSICNSENLTEANIRIFYRPHYDYKLVCKLLKSLLNVKSLTLSPSNLEVLNTNGGINLLSPLCNLKHLSVNLRQADKEFLGLICLLRSSPCLETLSVDCHPYFETDDEMLSGVYNADEEVVHQLHLLPSLMKVEIKEFQGLKVEMEFVKHILQISVCLKEMVIHIHGRYYYLDIRMGKEHYKNFKIKKTETIETLLACTPASPDAKIFLK
ncbi:hypothetical protein MKW98_019083 [Papaver atlanticum]|uniref:F-box domain-containing protein n=1 Tax=Papaver atlanticum TaxID=357466 RepID=A0AAD4TJD3_9MAGN|nr:hypothetical protein MKW98_019083 [Papaver atlanticum]